jgi:hypothetical protein
VAGTRRFGRNAAVYLVMERRPLLPRGIGVAARDDERRVQGDLASDGNWVVYHGTTAIWASNTARCSSDIIFGGQGVITTYQPVSCHKFVNNSSLNSRKTYRLTMQSDGNLVEYTGASGGVAVWATNTAGK